LRIAVSNARTKYRHELLIAEWLAEPQRMQPVAPAQRWDLPVIESLGALADWLSLSTTELEWFAGVMEENPTFGPRPTKWRRLGPNGISRVIL